MQSTLVRIPAVVLSVFSLCTLLTACQNAIPQDGNKILKILPFQQTNTSTRNYRRVEEPNSEWHADTNGSSEWIDFPATFG
ncbi:hypothetical protein T03_12207 [Trichinella britovi]|uniref:Uncharacterized protein n=2 Tax=Trichinella TaxID=6333 RepID=A0A0V1CEP9_TRIBR|nr:hypothetical protein T05_13415 [Trichinella murrelli]KRY47735.1 hypothetical protein T03_12207 [Trichinella britovi]